MDKTGARPKSKQPAIHIDTGGDAVVVGNAALLVWADVPFPPAEQPPRNPAHTIARWQQDAAALPSTPLDYDHGRRWPLAELPPLPILSLDPTARLETAFRYAGVPLAPVLTRRDLPASDRHSLLKLGGDLPSRAGLLLTWEDVRAAPSDSDKAHLLREAGRAAQGGVALLLAPAPDAAFTRLWRELLAAALAGADRCLAVGPADFAWPAPLTWLTADPQKALIGLISEAVPLPLEEVPLAPARDTAAVRRLLNAAFSDDELTTFCYDHFRPVHETFSVGMTRTQKIQLLLDYCDRQGEMDRLLALVREANPVQYARFEAP
jgi:hypothetical protein